MNTANQSEDIMANIENYSLDHPGAKVILEFPEGDSYECVYCGGEYVDNGGMPTSSIYEERYEITYRVNETIKAGPNKNPKFDFISICEKNLPEKISCNNEVIYEASDNNEE